MLFYPIGFSPYPFPDAVREQGKSNPNPDRLFVFLYRKKPIDCIFFAFMMGFTSLRACSPPRPTGIFIKYRKTLDICQGFGDFIGFLKTEVPWKSGAGQQT